MYFLLKEFGWSPTNILDIGAYKGNWTREMRRWFPRANYTLVEPNNHPELKSVSARVESQLLSDRVQEVEWFSNGSTGDSMFQETTRHYTNVTPVTRTTTTLDLLFPNETFQFIKIDCQGAELAILAGGPNLVSRAEVLLLECAFAGQYNRGAPTFAEYVRYLDSLGFVPIDITEIHRANTIICQIDILWLRKTSPLWERVQSMMTHPPY